MRTPKIHTFVCIICFSNSYCYQKSKKFQLCYILYYTFLYPIWGPFLSISPVFAKYSKTYFLLMTLNKSLNLYHPFLFPKRHSIRLIHKLFPTPQIILYLFNKLYKMAGVCYSHSDSWQSGAKCTPPHTPTRTPLNKQS